MAMGSKVKTQVQVQQGENIAGHAHVSFMLPLAGVAVFLMVCNVNQLWQAAG